MQEKILCVDDNSNILAGYKRKLRKQFDITIAYSAHQGLKIIENMGPFAIVVSDIRMPVMDGIQFMKKVKENNPDCIRMILTGYADLETLITAVNSGQIFKFLLKPCATETFASSLQDGIKQYRQLLSKQQLQKDTFLGSVNNLIEILRITRPQIYKKSRRLKKYTNCLTKNLNLPDAWQFELAASLSLVGCISLPNTILEKVEAGKLLTSEEYKIFTLHSNLGAKLVGNIPRLETISEMIQKQNLPSQLESALSNLNLHDETTRILLGAEILKVVFGYDYYRIDGLVHEEIISILRKQRNKYNLHLVEALMNMKNEQPAQ